MAMESKVIYFEERRPENTDITLALVKKRLETSPIKKIVLASTEGTTAQKALAYFKDTAVQLIVVAHQFDFQKREHRFPKDLVKTLRAADHEVHFSTMLFHTDKFYGSNAPTAIANVLYSFSQGVKVCIEIAYMATDAGYLKTGETAIVIAGTGLGADTALVMQGGSTQNPRDLRVNEILCKPLNLAPAE
jgi:hypothetical protein